MAIVSGTLGSIAGVSKLLAGGMTKKKLMQGAGNMLKDKASGAVKNKFGRKKKKGGPGVPGEEEGGSIVQSSAGAIVPTSPLMGDIVIPYPTEPAKVRAKTTGVVNYKTISEQLESIVALTAAIEQVTGKSVKSKKKISETNRKNKEKAAKRAKEEGKENMLGGALGFLGQKASEVGEASGIFNFLSNVLTGFVVVKLLPMVPSILKGLQFVGGNLHLFFLGFRGLGKTIELGNKQLNKSLPTITKNLKKTIDPVKDAFTKAGTRIKNVFKALGDIVPKFVKDGFNLLSKGVRGAGEFVKNTTKALTSPFTTGTRTKELGATAKGLEKLTGGKKAVQNVASQTLQMRRMHGDEAARMYQGLVDNGMSNTKAAKYVNKQLKAGKITSAPMKGSLGGGIKGSKVFKGGPIKAGKRAVIKYLGKGPVVKKALNNIPIVGPLIVGVTSLLAGEPAAQALFKVGGTLVGGILGAFIPIPILGPIIGEILGEYVGDLMYVLLMGGGPGAVMDRMKKDITAVMSAGTSAMKWVGRGFDRFMKGVPKLKVPDLVPTWLIPEQFRSIPDPIWMLNPLNILDKMGLFWKAFFTEDSMAMGQEKDKNKTENDNENRKPLRSHFRRGTKGTREYRAAYAKWEEENKTNVTQSNPDPPPGATPPAAGGNESPPTVLAERPGSDSSGLKSVPASSSQSVTPYNAEGGNKGRKIFLHWTAGHHNQAYSSYHTVFLGDGKAVRYTPYGTDKKSHTAGANTGSIGLSLAAMAGGGENQKSWAVPPTTAQIDAMATEAAQIALDWGWDAATVDKNVMTHGEWERYATRNGILPGAAQRWDLDKLKPSDPRIDTSKVPSHGGNSMRAKIKAKMTALKSGALNNEETQQPEGTPDTPPPPSPPVKMEKPDKKNYTGRSGAERYAKDMMAYSQQQEGEKKEQQPEKVTNPEVKPTTPMAGDLKPEEKEEPQAQQPEVKPTTPMAGGVKPEEKEMKKPEREDYKGRSGAATYARAMERYKKQQESKGDESDDKPTTDSNTYTVTGVTYDSATGRPVKDQDLSGEIHGDPQITPQQQPASTATPVQRQASYDQPGGTPTPMVLPPKQKPQKSGQGGGATALPVGSGNVLNSYYKAQLLGFLYKQG